MSNASTENRSLLIVKSQVQSLTGAEGFLKNRDWKLFSTVSLKDALTYMIQNQPTFVMISVDHPNKKVRNLARVLTQAFPCCVIMFAEQGAAASLKMLSDSRSEYLLYPPVTGPAIERFANKYYKDQARKAQASPTERTHGALSADDGTISIRGGSVSAQSLLAQLMNDDGASGEGVVYSQGEGSQDSQNHYDPSHVGHYNPQGSDGQVQPSGHGSAYIPTFEGLDDADPYHANGRKSQNGGWVPQTPEERRKAGLLSDDEMSPRTKQQLDSIILKGTKESLEKSVIRGVAPGDEVQQIEESSNVACIVIESTRFSGYLVAAMGKDNKIDDEFVDKIREKLFKFLSENGEKLRSDEESMQIKIKRVPFEDWAVECAEFLRKSVHKGQELAMAFFPNPNVKAHFQESANAEMLTVSLNDLPADVTVDFNLYVYLPTNDKYVLYTPRGGKLYGKQKDKLVKQGVSHMHMMKVDVPDFNKYRAQNFLNNKIDEYEASHKELAETRQKVLTEA